MWDWPEEAGTVMASLWQHGAPPSPVGLPCLPATWASGTDLPCGSWDNACWELVPCFFALGALSLPWPWGGSSWVRQKERTSRVLVSCWGRWFPFPEGCALILAFFLSGSNAGRCLRNWERWVRSVHQAAARQTHLWWCDRSNARQCPAGYGVREGSAAFWLFFILF